MDGFDGIRCESSSFDFEAAGGEIFTPDPDTTILSSLSGGNKINFGGIFPWGENLWPIYREAGVVGESIIDPDGIFPGVVELNLIVTSFSDF